MSQSFGPSAYVGAIAHGNPVAATNRSGTIASGGVAQPLAPANTMRRGWSLMNLSSGDLWVNDLGGDAVAGQPSIRIAAGQLYESPAHGCSTAALSIFGATTSQAFTAREW